MIWLSLIRWILTGSNGKFTELSKYAERELRPCPKNPQKTYSLIFISFRLLFKVWPPFRHSKQERLAQLAPFHTELINHLFCATFYLKKEMPFFFFFFLTTQVICFLLKVSILVTSARLHQSLEMNSSLLEQIITLYGSRNATGYHTWRGIKWGVREVARNLTGC